MKNIGYYFFISAITILLLSSCNKESKIIIDKKSEIEGIWYTEGYLEEFNEISRLEYNFKKQGGLDILRVELDFNSREILGYRYRTLGKYRLEENHLILYSLRSFGNDDTIAHYTNLHNLQFVPNSDMHTYNYRYEIIDGENKLIIYFTSGRTSKSSLGKIILTKQQ